MSQPFARTLGILTTAAFVGIGLATAISYWPHHARSPFTEGQALLGQESHLFVDEQTGLQFKPPSGWPMQGRTMSTSKQPVSSRLVVKYKRLLPDVTVAWFRVSVHSVPIDQTTVNYLRNRKPPEKNWNVVKDVDSNLTIGDQRAARIIFAGPLDVDGRGSHNYSAEYYAVIRDRDLFEFSATFPTADEDARKQCRSCIESVVFFRR